MISLPEQLLKDLEEVRGFDTGPFVEAHDHAPVTSIRLHPVKKAAGIHADARVPWCPEGRYLQERPVFTLDPLYHAGAYYVQEASSMFLDHLIRRIIPDTKVLRVLDLCAAPGGKSSLLASILDASALLISNDVIRSRASILEENLVRWGYTNSWVTSNDPRDFGRLSGYFDVIVVDAPCSGSGLFRKDREALKEWSEANVTLCSQRQQRILADVWPSLKEDGLLVYATCSYSPQEDEQVLDALAAGFDVASVDVPVDPSWGIIEALSPIHGLKGYRFFPDKVKGEGFFIAALRKSSAAGSMKQPRFKSAHDAGAWERSRHLVSSSELICLPQGDGSYYAIRAEHEPDLRLLQGAVYLRKTGLNLGHPAGKDWIPSHEIALSVDKAAGLPCVETDKEQALHFLKKNDFLKDIPPKGWYLVNYEGLSLGWIKSLGNRINNYLPKHWRIRMDLPDEEWA